MKIVVQRVKYASCTVENNLTGKISNGYLLLVGFKKGDSVELLPKAANKVLNLRIFEDENGKMNLNIKQVFGKILSISQFTLYADTTSGNRPSFTEALDPQEALKLYKRFNEILRDNGIQVEEGIFGAHMDIALLNEGPVTILLEF